MPVRPSQREPSLVSIHLTAGSHHVGVTATMDLLARSLSAELRGNRVLVSVGRAKLDLPRDIARDLQRRISLALADEGA